MSSIFPIARFSLPDLILHARHIRARFEQPRAWFLLLHSSLISRSQIWQSGGGHFRLLLLRNGRKGGPASAPSVGALSDSESSPSSCSRLSTLLSGDVVLSESSSGVMTRWQGRRSFTWRGITYTKIDCWLIILVTLAELRGTSTLRHFDPHAVSDLVRAVLGT